MLRFSPGIVVVSGSFGTGLLTDSFFMKYFISEESFLLEPAITVEIEDPFETSPVSKSSFTDCNTVVLSFFFQISADNFTLIPQPCPSGYHLIEQRELAGNGQGADMSCECFERPEVIACEEDQDNVLVRVS